MAVEIIHGDCLDVLRGMASESVDAVVTDPPYELAFMGRRWDATGIAYNVDLWREALRVMKPGAHLLAFGGTRTYHRMACAIEDAGWEIRDSIHWCYGSGFPKSKNLDGERKGWGTALKPAHEPIVVARKPLVGTVAANVQAHGTGAINVDGCRVESGPRRLIDATANVIEGEGRFGTMGGSRAAGETTQGRWPSNLILTHSADCRRVGERRVRGTNAQGATRTTALGSMNDDGWAPVAQPRGRGYVDSDGTETIPAYDCAPDCPVALMDRQSGTLKSGEKRHAERRRDDVRDWRYVEGSACYADSGGASRFFPTFEHDPFLYQAKAPTRERTAAADGTRHPTQKPIALMRWLVRLVTPPGGTILDPFAGSGTTLVAARAEGMSAIGIEREAEYVEIVRARLAAAEAA